MGACALGLGEFHQRLGACFRALRRAVPPPPSYLESNRILGVSTAQWRQVDLQPQLQTTRLDAEGADRRCFGIEQSIFAAPHTPFAQLMACNLTDRLISNTV
jgi:hypothetical protein